MPGWRLLGTAWAALLVLTVGGAGVLQALGPPPSPTPPPPPVVATVMPSPAHPAGLQSPAPATPVQGSARTTVAGPVTALLEPPGRVGAGQGALPRIAPDGRMPRLVYAAPPVAAPDGVPQIAILVAGFGLSEHAARAAIQSLPGPVAFAVSTEAPAGTPLLDAARNAGHELLASIPMEPDGYPQDDEGAHSLLTGATPADNARNLAWALSRTQGAVGATGASDGMRGGRFAELTADFDPILAEIARRGLLYVDARPGRPVGQTGSAARSIDVVLDDQIGRAEIDAKLVELEQVARERGFAIGLAGPIREATLERIADWAKTLHDRGFVLVPVSQLVNPPARPVTAR